jgi:DNA-binding XRE family transcriptional regulator
MALYPGDMSLSLADGAPVVQYQAPRMNEHVIHLTLKARDVLHMNQRELGEALGLSRRTIQRWDHGHGSPDSLDLAKLAALVHPRDASLAAQIAKAGATTLEKLGLATPAPPVAAVAPPAPPPPPPPHLTDTVVCAAAEALDVPPPAVRPVLLAAFRRARVAGLRVEDVEAALSALLEPASVAPPGVAKGAKRQKRSE